MATTYETPVANDYLERRAELADALVSLTDLAVEANAPAETIQTLGHLQASLREPFLFVVVGEVKAGKSSLLNALFGQEFCRVDVLPATDKVHVFRYGEVPRDVPLHAELVERYQPVPFLRDFHIVDTPGTNTVVSQHQRITEGFVPMADLILFVFSVVNPWGASAWQFFEHLQRKWLKKVVFIVQQSDLREPQEVQTVVQHLRQTATARIGQTFPIFAVSAKKALLSKTTGVDKTRLWAESQFGQLEDYINEIVAGGEARKEKLRSTGRTAWVILQDLAEGARHEHGAAAADRTELERVRAAVAQHRGRAGVAVEAFLRGVDTAFARCLHQGENQLRQRLRTGATLGLAFGGSGRWPLDFQRNFESMLHAAVARQTAGALDLLEGELRSVWTQLSESMRANLSVGARAILLPGGADFAEQRPRLAERVEAATVETLTDERLETELRSGFASVVRAVRRTWLLASLLVVMAAGTALGSGRVFQWYGLAVAGLAVLVVWWGSRTVAVERGRVLKNYRVRMEERQRVLSESVAELVQQAIEVFYRRAEAVYAPLETYCETQEATHQPLVERVAELDEALVGIAGRI